MRGRPVGMHRSEGQKAKVKTASSASCCACSLWLGQPAAKTDGCGARELQHDAMTKFPACQKLWTRNAARMIEWSVLYPMWSQKILTAELDFIFFLSELWSLFSLVRTSSSSSGPVCAPPVPLVHLEW